MLEADHLDDLYAAIDDEDAFGRLPSTLARMAHSRSALIYRFGADGACQIESYCHFSPEMSAAYVGHFALNNPWATRVRSFGLVGRAVALCPYVPERELLESALYRDFFHYHGDDTGRCLGGEYVLGDSRLIIATHRALGAEAYGEADEAGMDRALRHVRRVLAARDLLGGLRREGDLLRALIEQAGRAILVVGPGLSIRFCSEAAERLLAAGDALRLREGRLRLRGTGQGRALLRAIDDVLARRAGVPSHLLLPRPDGRPPLEVAVMPFALEGRSLCALSITDPEARVRDGWAAIAQRFALSPGELALARGLHAGRTLAEIAGERGRSVETLRSQLKSLFLKTDTSRQSLLLAKLEAMLRTV
ncbi:hypothetical protein L6Q21_02365 [Sandaracinobacter sp. RS1-74]|uniref:helix-turn-helix transcriptional regulator n=1 Tax=Sandaracinobacteroides sayramensis TaxID=2913411 RepID=UPI001EDAA016|nr:hypothetical protein [Sandaracinobacteroides sayramensis]MCG2839826.1 hypothetical protein [Sandaracinobacteroides sayramensis]